MKDVTLKLPGLVNDKVWILFDHKAIIVKVLKITIILDKSITYELFHANDKCIRPVDKVFASKEELLESL